VVFLSGITIVWEIGLLKCKIEKTAKKNEGFFNIIIVLKAI